MFDRLFKCFACFVFQKNRFSLYFLDRLNMILGFVERSPKRGSDPDCFLFGREIVSVYCAEVRELGYRLQELISESLGLEKDSVKNTLGEQGQHMAVNFYPPCPQPDLTYGLPGHTDPNALTILLQDLQVAGLQVLKDGKWVAVKPHPNAFVINIGDQLQVTIQILHCAKPNTQIYKCLID